MSYSRHSLFDPRRPNQKWPEPNDDPNIPYSWGLNGYLGATLPFSIGEAQVSQAELDALIVDLGNMEIELEALKIVKNFSVKPPEGSRFRKADGTLEVVSLLNAVKSNLLKFVRISTLSDEDFKNAYQESVDLRAFYQGNIGIPTGELEVLGQITNPTSYVLLAPEIRELEHLLKSLKEDIEVLERIDPTSAEVRRAKVLLVLFKNLNNFKNKDEFLSYKQDLDAAFVLLHFKVDRLQDENPGDIRYLRQSEMPTERDGQTPTTIQSPIEEAPPKGSSTGLWIFGAALVTLGALAWSVRKEKSDRK